MDNYYRAKTIDNTEWVYGTPIICNKKAFIVPQETEVIRTGNKITMDAIEINKDTICKFLKHINGRDFFEKDIIYDRVLKMTGIILYDNRSARFICETSTKTSFIPFDLCWKGTLFDNLEDFNKQSTKN